MPDVEQTLAVVSWSAPHQLGGQPWFEFSDWTWRAAEEGPDAANHQLMDFARRVIAQRPGAVLAVASGDGIFADLVDVGVIEVVVPRKHHGVSQRLRNYIAGAGRPSAEISS